MVFGLLASAVTPFVAYAFPVFASYKAIQAHDATQMVPWLMFWSVSACLATIEHYTSILIPWLVDCLFDLLRFVDELAARLMLSRLTGQRCASKRMKIADNLLGEKANEFVGSHYTENSRFS